jgi:hypothetical protein
MESPQAFTGQRPGQPVLVVCDEIAVITPRSGLL